MLFWVILLIPLATSAKKTVRKIKKKPTFNDNILYVTEQNMSFAFEDLPAVFLLVQLGSDKDGRFRTRADFLAAASNLGSRCYFALMDGDRNQKFVRSTNQKDSKGYFFYRYGRLVGRYSGESSTDEITKFAMSRTGIAFTTFDEYTIAQDFIDALFYILKKQVAHYSKNMENGPRLSVTIIHLAFVLMLILQMN